MDEENLLDPEELDEIHPFLSVHKDIIPGSVMTSYDNSKEQWCTLARTLAAGLSGDSEYVQELDEEAQGAYYEAFFRLMKRLFTLSSPDTETPTIHDPASLIFQNDAYHYCNQRRVFWTQNGSYGLGPQCMRTGDVVAVLFGGNTPYVLRPQDGKFLFMGQAYVDAIMQGQLVHEVQTGKLQEQEFCLV